MSINENQWVYSHVWAQNRKFGKNEIKLLSSDFLSFWLLSVNWMISHTHWYIQNVCVERIGQWVCIYTRIRELKIQKLISFSLNFRLDIWWCWDWLMAVGWWQWRWQLSQNVCARGCACGRCVWSFLLDLFVCAFCVYMYAILTLIRSKCDLGSVH